MEGIFKDNSRMLRLKETLEIILVQELPLTWIIATASGLVSLPESESTSHDSYFAALFTLVALINTCSVNKWEKKIKGHQQSNYRAE